MTLDVTTSGLSRRQVYGAASIALGVALAAALIAPGGGGWLAIAFLIAPDLAGLLSIDRTLKPGQMHPRAVPLYNLLHHVALPATLGAAALLWLGLPWGVAALAWALHIAVDRTVGYGPRDRDGFQRG